MTTITRTRKATEQKTVQVVARITFKAEERKAYTIYIVRSSNGVDTYTVTLVNGKATGCDCPARKPCYHMPGCEAIEPKMVAQIAQAKDELAVAAHVAEEVLGAADASDLTAHLDDSMPEQADGELASQAWAILEAEHKAALPVVVIDYEKYNSWVIEGGKARCVRTADLALACPGGYQLAGEDGVERLNAILGCAGESEQARKATEREMYRDMFPDDYGYYGDVA